jgi:hypothetical protein
MLDRRRFLYLSAATIVLAGIPISLRMLDDDGWHLDQVERRLFGQIGHEYFTELPMEKDVHSLRKNVEPENPQRMRARILADFANGDSLVLAGWHLSRTEARMIALIALTKGYLSDVKERHS